ncbi:MAG: HAD hydrolase-like protein, partial [Holophagales bacterium]|nr:HAD hydrolase-like protein [Holophagales bacterium]
HLTGRGDVSVGLLTGNWRDGARIKLGRFALERYFPFGAFGDDGLDRRELVPVALERAAAHVGRSFAPEEALIVGDTVLDVDCARSAGIPCLAVSTGFTEASALREAGATWVYGDLRTAARELDVLR